MKATGKHWKAGTRVRHAEHGEGTIMAVQTRYPTEAVVLFDTGNARWPGPGVSHAAHIPPYDGPGWYVHAIVLKRIKPPKGRRLAAAVDSLQAQMEEAAPVPEQLPVAGRQYRVDKTRAKPGNTMLSAETRLHGRVVEVWHVSSGLSNARDQYCTTWLLYNECLVPVDEAPAEPTLPDGCPVDAECHAAMTAAGWEWMEDCYVFRGDAYIYPLSGYGCCCDDYERYYEASNTLAAWRERSKA